VFLNSSIAVTAALNFARAMTGPQESLAFTEQNHLTLFPLEAISAKAGVACSEQLA
jgi:hypothetical protein